MPRVDPSLVPVVFDLERGLRELGIPFGIVGALVPELLLNVRPHRMTNDVDVAVVVEGLNKCGVYWGSWWSANGMSSRRSELVEVEVGPRWCGRRRRGCAAWTRGGSRSRSVRLVE